MRTHLSLRPRTGLVVLSLALGAATNPARATTPPPTTNPPADSGSFMTEMQHWQKEMSDVFHNTWNRLWQDRKSTGPGSTALASASVDLREQPDSYTVRLILPGRDLAQVRVAKMGDTLRIVAPADGHADRYEQIIELAAAAPGGNPTIERNPAKNLMVITVPKSTPALATTTSPALLPDAQDRDLLDQMRRMQREMDQAFDRGFAPFQDFPEFGQFFNRPVLGSAVDLQDKGRNYVVRAYLPDRDMNNVQVTVKGQTLRIEAREQTTEDNNPAGTSISESARYSQLLTLPGPVQDSKMVVDRKANMLVVSLPKALST